jgi:hypothetical protein
MTKLYSIIIVFLLICSNKVLSQEILIASDGGEDIFVIKNTIKRVAPNIIEVWLKLKLSVTNTDFYRQKRIQYLREHNVNTDAYEKYLYLKVKRRYNCLTKKCSIIEGNTYAVGDKFIEHQEYDSEVWISIVPGTTSQVIFDYLCK